MADESETARTLARMEAQIAALTAYVAVLPKPSEADIQKAKMLARRLTEDDPMQARVERILDAMSEASERR